MKRSKDQRSSVNLLIGVLISLGFIFISFEWSSSEIHVRIIDDQPAHVFVPEQQIPIYREKNKKVEIPIPNASYEKLKLVKDMFLLIDEPIDFSETPAKEVMNTPSVNIPKEVEYIDEILPSVEIMPKFPGGEVALYVFLKKNLKYPEIAKEIGISGMVYVQFVIEKDGSVSQVTIARGKDRSLDEEALRIVNMMPKWKPGIQNGQKVRVRMILPVKFVLR
ncbi:energy transducer TonB [Saccharicrinis sp. FJH62]|uniref:energy transducer TonB n=1 Tax=Saccharicrinis sp. FJH62 TaxID=3344657 RepID=UPI0035D3FE7E